MNYYRIAACFMLFASNVHAQNFVKFNEATTNKTTEGKVVTITLPFKIIDGYHIQSETELKDGMIPTEIMFEDSELYEISSFKYIKKHNEIVVLSHDEYNVLIDEFEIVVTLKLKNNTSKSQLNGQLYYQACTDKQCFFPRSLSFQVSII